jgi:hypothetical protein
MFAVFAFLALLLGTVGRVAADGVTYPQPVQFSLLNGDMNGDGWVEDQDWSIFGGAYYKCYGEPGYTAVADLNGDGWVEDEDYSLMGGDWYLCGDDDFSGLLFNNNCSGNECRLGLQLGGSKYIYGSVNLIGWKGTWNPQLHPTPSFQVEVVLDGAPRDSSGQYFSQTYVATGQAYNSPNGYTQFSIAVPGTGESYDVWVGPVTAGDPYSHWLGMEIDNVSPIYLPEASVAAPVFTPTPTTFTDTMSIQILCTDGSGSSVYYTTDGSNPAITGKVLLPTDSITIFDNTNFTARCLGTNGNWSWPVTASYTSIQTARIVVGAPSAAGKAINPMLFGSGVGMQWECILMDTVGIHDGDGSMAADCGQPANLPGWNSLIGYAENLGVGLMRYPEGCTASYLHWRNAVGPQDSRRGFGWDSYNDDGTGKWFKYPFYPRIGTDEFVDFCNQIGCRNAVICLPYFPDYHNPDYNTAIVTSTSSDGSSFTWGPNTPQCTGWQTYQTTYVANKAQECANWVAYCNWTVDAALTSRAQNLGWSMTTYCSEGWSNSVTTTTGWEAVEPSYWGWLREQNRQANGQQPAPNGYGIKYWEIGNEVYLSTPLQDTGSTGGKPLNLYAEQYAADAQVIASAIKAVDPNAKFALQAAADYSGGQGTLTVIGSGNCTSITNQGGYAWNRALLNNTGSWVDYLVPHPYTSIWNLDFEQIILSAASSRGGIQLAGDSTDSSTSCTFAVTGRGPSYTGTGSATSCLPVMELFVDGVEANFLSATIATTTCSISDGSTAVLVQPTAGTYQWTATVPANSDGHTVELRFPRRPSDPQNVWNANLYIYSVVLRQTASDQGISIWFPDDAQQVGLFNDVEMVGKAMYDLQAQCTAARSDIGLMPTEGGFGVPNDDSGGNGLYEMFHSQRLKSALYLSGLLNQMIGVGVDGYCHFGLTDNGYWGEIADYRDPNSPNRSQHVWTYDNICAPCYYTMQMYASSLCPASGVSSALLPANVTSPQYPAQFNSSFGNISYDGWYPGDWQSSAAVTTPHRTAVSDDLEGPWASTYYMPAGGPAFLDAVSAYQSDGHTVVIVTNRSSACIDTMVEFQGQTINSSTTANIWTFQRWNTAGTSIDVSGAPYYADSIMNANANKFSGDNLLESCNLQFTGIWDPEFANYNESVDPDDVRFTDSSYNTPVSDQVETDWQPAMTLGDAGISCGSGSVNGQDRGWIEYQFQPYSITAITIPAR